MSIKGIVTEEIPCISIKGLHWYSYPGFREWLSQEGRLTWAPKEKVPSKDYTVSDYDDVFLLVDNVCRDEQGEPSFIIDGEELEEYCPQVYKELGEVLLGEGFTWGVVWIKPL